MGKGKSGRPRRAAPPPAAGDIGAQLRKAVAAHQAGRLDQARAAYEEILRSQPEQFDALHLLGVVALQRGEYQESVDLIARAIEVGPENAEAWSNRGTALLHLKRLEEALASYERAVALKPAFADAWSNRGNALLQLKRPADALASCDRALALKSDHAEAWSSRGKALRDLKRPQEALASFDRVFALRSAHPEDCLNRGSAMFDLGRLEEALASFDRALVLRPDYPEACNNRGNTLRELGRLDEALAAYDRALALKPDHASAWSNRGNVLRDLNRTEAALASLERALELRPDHAGIWTNHGNLLKDLGRPDEALASQDRAVALDPRLAEAWANRGNALIDLRRPGEALASIEKALALEPGLANAYTRKIFVMDLLPELGFAQHQAERRRFHEMFARPLLPEGAVVRNATGVPVPLKLGYVSADFRLHSASAAFGVVLRRHDRSSFRLALYSGVKVEDEVTGRFRALADEWVPAAALSDAALAERIRADGIDILVDLSGHSAGNRLLVFARKPAPVQITAWGHATGTGLEAMDYFFADPVAVPPAVRHLFAEEVCDLPCIVPYEAPAYLPALAELPALRRRSVTFGCLNRFGKVSPEAIALWARILKAVAGSRMLLKDRALGNPSARSLVLETFAKHGIGAERVELRGGSAHPEHLAVYNEVDIALDPFPQGGGVTTWEAMAMGVPVVSKLGESIPARVCGSIMTALGLGDWVADDEQAYAAIAVERASHLERLAHLRRESRSRIAASPAGNPEVYTRAVEAAYLLAWRKTVLART